MAIAKVAAVADAPVRGAVMAGPTDADLAVRAVAMDVAAEADAVDAEIAMTARIARGRHSATGSMPTENLWQWTLQRQPPVP